MKKIILFLLVLLNYYSSSAQLKYKDAHELTVIGKAMHTGDTYHRVDTALYNKMPQNVKSLFTCAAGIAVSFKTNSSTIGAKWSVTDRKAGNNMTPIMQKGLDLYIKKGDDWVFAGVARPSGINSQKIIIENMDDSEKECLLYLPLYDEIKELQIGVNEESFITPQENPFHKKVVIYGSSILQGASASRPGMAYPSRMSRNTGIYFINLGLSASAKMEKEVADMISDIEADAYVLDCVPNSSSKQINERTDYLVSSIRNKYPDAPIIMVESIIRESGNFDLKVRERVTGQNKAFRDEYIKLKKKGIKHLFYIEGKDLIGNDHEGTIDGTHPNDIGFDRMIKIIQPRITKIVKNK